MISDSRPNPALPPIAIQTNSFDDLEASWLKKTIAECGGSKIEAARKLGVHKSTLFRKLKKLGIEL